ncbi:universal stress protein [Streptomyces deccanensis]|uniref:universal stress protein n=1 Tax=Streptomyces deccanensis TaxID=424188 RepID=UPI001EFB7788|nr:universal stress protein [Streptomyces deccanensis]ULR55503.1 universal stress protein [Streptomyces deccanensis]
MLRHVTAGVDESTESLAAAHWAAGEALRLGAELRLVHTWAWHPRPPASVPADVSERHWAEQTLDRAVVSVRSAHPGLRIVDRLVADSPVNTLLEEADKAELLVLGSRGLGAVTGFVVGSVSQRLVGRSSRPVVLVRARQTLADDHLPAPDGISPDEIPQTPYRDVVLGLDTARPCDELIEFAFAAAARRDARLRVIHAYRLPTAHTVDAGSVPTPAPALVAERERAVVATLRPWCEKFPRVPVVESVVRGRAATELVQAATGAGLIVVGRRTRDAHLGIGPHIGPVTHAVLHHAGCPVAVVPHP